MQINDILQQLHPTLIVAAISAIIGGGIWLIRLEGRITLLFEKIVALTQANDDKSKHVDRYLESQFSALTNKINDLSRRFDRVEARLDSLMHIPGKSND